ncbi:MAG: hypothetical protein LBN26_08520 [Christensenellaceae bacterium]|jgi:flavodoxin|nr:hypothetical protein [Christensenellaceae bacterium]
MKTKARLLAGRIAVVTIIVVVALFVIVKFMPQAKPQAPSQAGLQTEPQAEFQAEPQKKSLVLYFSRAENIADASEYLNTLGGDVDAITSASVLMTDSGKITGNVGLLARWIAEEAGADIHSIHVKDLYPQPKKETQNIVLQEQLDGVWPEIVPSTEEFDQYDVIYIGFPNWYAEPPRALYTFLEENDLDGKIIIPFTSDDTNGFSDSVDILKSKLPNAAVLSVEDGLLVNRKELFDAKERTQKWVKTVALKAESAKNDPLSTSEGQKAAAQALIGQTVTHEEIKEKVGEDISFSKGTNGCAREITSGRFYYPGFVIYCQSDDHGKTYTVLSID